MSQKCEKLHEILKKGKKFDVHSLDDANLRKELNHVGLYIFYEKKETGHSGDRIVRVGRAISQKKLFGRIYKKHLYGEKDHSIFRKQIGRAILHKKLKPLADKRLENCLANWNEDGKKAPETEKEVSRYLAENCYFKAIAIEDIEKVKELEKKITATVAQCNECKPSKSWLGNYSPQVKIRQYGLWQEQNLTGEELSDDDLAEIENHLIKA